MYLYILNPVHNELYQGCLILCKRGLRMELRREMWSVLSGSGKSVCSNLRRSRGTARASSSLAANLGMTGCRRRAERRRDSRVTFTRHSSVRDSGLVVSYVVTPQPRCGYSASRGSRARAAARRRSRAAVACALRRWLRAARAPRNGAPRGRAVC